MNKDELIARLDDPELLEHLIAAVEQWDSARAAATSFDARLAHLEIEDISDARRESLGIASGLGADDETLRILAAANRVCRRESIVLPAKYGHTSRAKGWARKGRGDKAVWGEADGRGYRVDSPGKWIVFSSDGFRRQQQEVWAVKTIKVGKQTWFIAD